MKEEEAVELKALKDYALVRGELYRRMPGRVLSRCVGRVEAQRKLKDVHDKTYGSCGGGGQPLPQASKGRLLLAKHG